MTAARNILIVLAIAAAVEFLPGGGDAAAIVSRTLSVAFIAVILLGLAWAYRRFALDLDLLPFGYRALLYGTVGGLVLAFAASDRLTGTGAGSLAFIAILAAAAGALYAVWRRYRALA